jgi:hypothetical protein
MPWSFIIPAAASLIGGSMQASAAEKAAKTTAGAADAATALQKRIYEESVARQKPFYDVGVNALPDLVKASKYTPFTMQQFQADPGYAFRMQEGLKALDRSAASRGGLLSGATLRGAQRYGQDLGSQEYTNAFNRYQLERQARLNPLQSLTGMGQTTANTLGTEGQTMASNIGNIGMTQGANLANAGLIGARARSSAYGDVANQLSKVNWGQLGDYLGGKAVPESPFY